MMHMSDGCRSSCFILSVLFIGGNIPIAVGMLDGFNHQAGFHGEGAQHNIGAGITTTSMVAGVF